MKNETTKDRKINALIELAKRGASGEKQNAKQKLEEMLENGSLEYNNKKTNNLYTENNSNKNIVISVFKFFKMLLSLPFEAFIKFKDIPFKDWFYSKFMFKRFIKETISSIKWFLIFIIPSIIGCIFLLFVLIMYGVVMGFFNLAKKIL